MRFVTTLQDRTEEEAIHVLLEPRPRLAIDIETVSLKNKLMLGIAIAITSEDGFYFFNMKDELVKKVIEKAPLVLFHNASFDVPALEGLGIHVKHWEDTMMLAYSAGILNYGLEELSHDLLKKPYTPVTAQWNKSDQGNIAIDHVKMAGWSIQHAMNTFKLWDTIPVTELYKTIDRPCVDLVIEMEGWGLLIDQYRLTLTEQETMVKVKKIEEELKHELGEINLASNPQVGAALQLKGIIGTRKTGSGATSVSEESLSPLHNPIADKVLKWRSLMKTLTTYVPAFRTPDINGKIHTNYGYTNTGRWNSSGPNFQNITRDEKFEDE